MAKRSILIGCLAILAIPSCACPVHRSLLRMDVVRVRYGLPPVPPIEEREAQAADFPMSNRIAQGGCVPMMGMGKHRLVFYCKACRTAEEQWRASQTEAKQARLWKEYRGPAACDVHRTPFRREMAVEYGYRPVPSRELWDAWRELFPNSNRVVEGGCALDPETSLTVFFCPTCRHVEGEWRNSHQPVGYDRDWRPSTGHVAPQE